MIVAAGQAFVAAQQVHLDRAQQQLATAVAKDQNLQLTRAQLESPTRILSFAEHELGMVVPSHVTYLVPVDPNRSGAILGAEDRDVTSPARRTPHRRLPEPPVRRARLHVVAAVMVIASLGLVVRLAVVQVADGARYAAYEKAEVIQKVTLAATRGAIYDSTGDVLAVSVPRTDVIADDFQITAPRTEADTLAPLLGVPVARLVAELSEHNGYVVLARGLKRRRGGPDRASRPRRPDVREPTASA